MNAERTIKLLGALRDLGYVIGDYSDNGEIQISLTEPPEPERLGIPAALAALGEVEDMIKTHAGPGDDVALREGVAKVRDALQAGVDSMNKEDPHA
jgi:hypothetical protein